MTIHDIVQAIHRRSRMQLDNLDIKLSSENWNMLKTMDEKEVDAFLLALVIVQIAEELRALREHKAQLPIVQVTKSWLYDLGH